MSLNHLLYYTVFILLLSKVDVLLGIRKTFSRFTISDLGQFKVADLGELRSVYIPMLSKERPQFQRILRKKPHNYNICLTKLSRYMDRFSLSGRIWHHVWRTCIIQCCPAHNKFGMLQKNFLAEINFYRKVHGSGPLTLDHYLTTIAQNVASTSASIGKWSYFDRNNNGVNYATVNEKESPLLINKWYKESKNYNYNTLFEKSKFLHFTNLVWKHTLAVGIGIAQKNSDLYICLKFFPEGNQSFKFQQNVGKPKYSFMNSRNFFKS